MGNDIFLDAGPCTSCRGYLAYKGPISYKIIHNGVIAHGVLSWECETYDCNNAPIAFPKMGPLMDLLEENPNVSEVTWNGENWEITCEK